MFWIISKLPRATFSVMRPTGNLRKKRAKFSENEGKAVGVDATINAVDLDGDGS